MSCVEPQQGDVPFLRSHKQVVRAGKTQLPNEVSTMETVKVGRVTDVRFHVLVPVSSGIVPLHPRT